MSNALMGEQMVIGVAMVLDAAMGRLAIVARRNERVAGEPRYIEVRRNSVSGDVRNTLPQPFASDEAALAGVQQIVAGLVARGAVVVEG